MAFQLKPLTTLFVVVLGAVLVVAVGLLGLHLKRRASAGINYNASLGAIDPITFHMCESPEENCNIRLNPDVVPRHYELYLFPNFTSGLFSGRVSINLRIFAYVDHVRLHTKYLTINSTNISKKDGEQFEIKGYENSILDYWIIKNTDGSSFPPADYILTLTFNGSLTRDILGVYRSSYIHPKDNTTKLVVSTKFQSTYARRAFPCFDEPGFKSTFSLTVVKPNQLVAISNMPVLEEQPNLPAKGLTTVKFDKSVPMVTYLLAFAIGDLAYVERKSGRGIPVRIYTTSFQIQNAEYASNITADIVDYFENYFNVQYPLPKLDIVGIPDFISGAMEHWGMVSFRESNLLYQPGVGAASNKQRIASVIAHELAHMWFGNLVTLKWWNDLWLNEGFASYMEYKGVAAVHGDWEIEKQFVGEDLVPILGLDGQHSSHPIVQDVTNPNQITELFDKISYNKGASVIRMLENFLGPESFRRGVTAFLKKFSYSNAETSDLWEHLQAEATSSSDVFNISLVMDTWTKQMGYPVLSPERTDDGHWVVRQQRFLDNRELSNEGSKGTQSPFGYRWEIPIGFEWATTSNNVRPTQLVWMRHDSDTVKLPVEREFRWLKLNVGSFGYYRTMYSSEMYGRLKQDFHETFSAEERCSTLDDVFSLAFASYVQYNDTLNFATVLKKEEHYIPWSCATDHILIMSRLLKASDPDSYAMYRKYVLSLVVHLYEGLNWEDGESEPHLARLLKPIILSLACEHGHPPCLEQTKKLFELWINNLSSPAARVPPGLRDTVYKWGIHQSDNGYWEKMLEVYLRESDPQEKIRLLRALAYSKDPSVLRKFLELAKKESVIKRQDYFALFKFYSLNPIASPIVWDFYRAEFPRLVERFTLNDRYFGRIIVDLTYDFATSNQLKDVEDFFVEYPKAGAGTRARETALENIRNNIGWTEKNMGVIRSWLKSQSL